MEECRNLGPEDLHVGLKAAFERDVTEADVLAFGRLSGDLNPLHLSSSYAEATNLSNRIVHGAFQVGLASALVGMHLPGRNALVGSFHSQFLAPLKYPTRVLVSGEITTWNSSTRAGQVRVAIQEMPDLIVTAQIHVSFTLHENKSAVSRSQQSVAPAVATSAWKPENDKLIIVTGASGGLGATLAAEL